MDQKTTGELMQVLNHLSDQSELTDYLNELEESPPESFLEYFHAFANVQSMPKTELLQRCGLNRTTFYHIMNGNRQPGRDHIIALCLAAGLTLPETQRALELTEHGILYSRNRRDAILIFCINRGITNHMDVNELLDQFGEALLVAERE
ncbi:MAG: XRE family transcriptional regulator [Lachnospiraceae bacterium]|nr:XRE family transcriptional regulator [Lachnospiraceae bacterium]